MPTYDKVGDDPFSGPAPLAAPLPPLTCQESSVHANWGDRDIDRCQRLIEFLSGTKLRHELGIDDFADKECTFILGQLQQPFRLFGKSLVRQKHIKQYLGIHRGDHRPRASST
jgi:hypothetical protein